MSIAAVINVYFYSLKETKKKLTPIRIIINGMDLNNIVLPVSLVADLYESVLIDTTAVATIKTAIAAPTESGPSRTDKPESAWKSLGSNQKKILLVVNNPEVVFMPDNELTFLTGILGACKLTLADVAIVNRHTIPEVAYKELLTHFSSKVVLLFDVEPADFGLPMSFPLYQLQAFAGNTFLYSPSLKQLENDRVEKSKLWVCLKRLFNL
jgi:hypothetical protein